MLKALIPIAIALTATVPALAQDADQRVARVPYGDLDLSSDTGRAALNQRIERAVRIVCTDPNGAGFADRALRAKCRTTAHTAAARARDEVLANTKSALGAVAASGR